MRTDADTQSASEDAVALKRVVIQQPALPAYRVPVFSALARRRRLDVTVYYGSREGSPPSVEDVPFRAVPVSLREWSVFGHAMMWHTPQWRCASKRRCDTLVLSWDLHYASLIPALLRARMSGVRTILWGHGYSKRETPWRQRMRACVARLADALLFYNEAAAQRYREAGWDDARLHVAPNALDQAPIQAARAHWRANPDELADFQREHELDTGPVLLFVSRLDPANRLDLLIDALPALTSEFPQVQCVIIGKGDLERARLEQRAGQLNVADRVRFPGPIYDEMQLAPWFLIADVFCYPCNIGLSILHAFGYGVPVVTSDRTDLQNPEIEALRDGENGALFKHDDAHSLAQAIASLLRDTALRTRAGEAALHTVQTQFTLNRMVDGMARAIRGEASNAQSHPSG